MFQNAVMREMKKAKGKYPYNSIFLSVTEKCMKAKKSQSTVLWEVTLMVELNPSAEYFPLVTPDPLSAPSQTSLDWKTDSYGKDQQAPGLLASNWLQLRGGNG